MGAIKVSFKQRYYNIDIECCSNIKKELERKQRNYHKKTGKNFKFHCCFCYQLKTLNFIEPVNHKNEETKFTCKECFKNRKSSVINSQKFSLFSTIKPPQEAKFNEIQSPPFKVNETINEGDYVINENSDSEKTEVSSNEDLKLFEIGEEFTNDRRIEKYQNEIEILKNEVESLKLQLDRDDKDLEYYINESNRSWKMCNKLVTEIIDLVDELGNEEISRNKKYRRNSI